MCWCINQYFCYHKAKSELVALTPGLLLEQSHSVAKVEILSTKKQTKHCATVQNSAEFVFIHLLKEESFSELTFNLSLTPGHTSKILWHHNFRANHGPVCNLHKCDVETCSLQCTNTVNELDSEVGDIFVSVNNICIFKDCGFLMIEKEGMLVWGFLSFVCHIFLFQSRVDYILYVLKNVWRGLKTISNK